MSKDYPQYLPEHPTTMLFTLDDPRHHLYDHLAYYFRDQFPLNMHYHDFYELNIIVEGEGIHYVEKNNYPMSKGDVFAIPPHVKHGYWAISEHLSVFHLLLDKSVIKNYMHTLLQFPGYKTLFQIEPQFRINKNLPPFFLHLSEKNFATIFPKLDELVALAAQYAHVPNELFNIHAIGLVCDLANLIYVRNEEISQNHHHQNDVYKILLSVEYLEKNYSQRINIKTLTNIINVSAATYLRAFKRLFNTTPIEYLTSVRIQKAAVQLRSTNDQISKIAQDCGFFDSSHFSDSFRKIMNCTPSEYRREKK